MTNEELATKLAMQFLTSHSMYQDSSVESYYKGFHQAYHTILKEMKTYPLNNPNCYIKE